MIQRTLFYDHDAHLLRLELFSGLLERMFRESIYDRTQTAQLTLLYASVLKVSQSAKAVRSLAQAGCVEEIQAIARSMIEVTVNAAYLQHAGTKELDRFVEFHPEVLYKYPETWRPEKHNSFTSDVRRRLSKLKVWNGRVALGRETNPNWSEKTLIERAALSDDASNAPLMTLLVRRCYPQTHDAVHGTMKSLRYFVAAVDAMGFPSADCRMAELREAVFVANLSLLTFCLYLNANLGLHFDGAIEAAAVAGSSTAGLKQSLTD